MAKRPIKQSYREMCPDMSPELQSYLQTSDRRIEYFEYDLKVERRVRGKDSKTIGYRPALEVSLDMLVDEKNVQFRAEIEDVAETVVQAAMIEKLRHCLPQLAISEQKLIQALFFEGMTERQYAEISGIPQKTINDRRHRILFKLKKLLESRK